MGKTEGDRKITIKVTKHQIPLHIKPEDEELYREAETALRLRLYELGKTIKRDEDFMLAAIAYELMLEKLTSEKEMEQLGKEIDKTLSKIDM
ncbi:MAG: cell division protein ZapA [Paludibacteraceae bacterium]|nr:cell division protein ZapA [Paludibacteraceae bacterium]MBQ1752739.1 cell division protein ZapA [Paludibacteraceae bacterium]MBQ1851180.1 cell division protein ZapA [Paludibacteraceae bacterium]MBQ2064531.1 cell division protein ZapA [Paludibacteraceae bacterium]